ncbi:choice-of-anchor B family protein [Aliikangiella marina]|uniref:Choice-of-anchor B family protein n=1 Tax=Aliikangiella marina TaxID=1712262 RepID=A0A545T6N1_9GAMM|nr:choice-of-anchor B family protein [Aliikangiella marina]TQV72832.1 choice-of-anchor B family protein [Aliikangiella marina]
MNTLTRWTLATICTLACSNISAHSEHDKARFVAPTGKDVGFCDNALRPCKTISYAVQKANKGDKVLVASGEYQIASTEELFYLKSEIVPILAGYNRFDHFQTQSPENNPTVLFGVPADMLNDLRQKGFQVIADGKNLTKSRDLQNKLTAYKELNKTHALENCVGGFASSFPCENVDLVSHMPLSAFSSRPTAGNDIWGHVDLNTGREYALFGVRNGAVVVDLGDPENPVEVGTIRGGSSTWRDLKVYQYFDESSRRWRAYAYVTIDQVGDGVTIIDLNDLPNSISLVERNSSVGTAHNVYISNVDYTLNTKLENAEPVLQLTGANTLSGSFHNYSLTNPETIDIENNQVNFGEYTHDGASVTISDSRKDTECIKATINCSVFIGFNEKQMRLFDISDPADTRLLSTASYNDVSFNNKYVHSGWVTEDKQYVLLHDEFDEFQGGLNTTVRIFDISNLRSPTQVGQWTGPTTAIDHNGFVRGNRYYMSNYERGLTILDITDPASPTVAGYFDTFPTSDRDSFNGAWGVYPFLPSGLILVSDINSGLYVLRDNTQANAQGTLQFESGAVEVDNGSTATINVTRSGVSGSATSVAVSYELISGSANSNSDFTPVSGTLNWTGNEQGVKSFNIDILPEESSAELAEEFFVRLYDPRSGATLSSPSYLTVKINGAPNVGVIEFVETNVVFVENSGANVVEVTRNGGTEGAATVNYQVIDGTAETGVDFELAGGTLNWSDGDSESKQISITIIDDNTLEGDENFTIRLSDATGSSLGADVDINVEIADNESNTAPTITQLEDFEANAGQTVSLTANVSDADGDEVTYLWQQVSGQSVQISNADQLQASFVAPSAAGVLEFSLTVTDIRGGVSSETVSVSIIVATAPPPSSSSGGGSMGSLLLLAFLLVFNRRATKH